MDPDTFITEVSRELPGEIALKSYFEQINSNISCLDDRLSLMLKRHENDFFAAFKSHLFQLNSQLQELKNRHEENLMQIQKDETVVRLQKSMEWFRDEAVVLGDSYKHYKRTAERWKAKASSLEEDRKFLETQVKNARKQNRKLMAQIDFTKKGTGKASNSTFLTETNLPRSSMQTKRTYVPSTKAGLFLTQLCAQVPVRSQEFVNEIEGYLANQETEFKRTIATLRSAVQTEKTKIKAENAVQSSLLIEKTDLEELFLECVEEVSREVARSRNKQFVQSRFGKRGSEPMPPRSGDEKQKVLEMLVSSEPALILLYERLFPHRAVRRRNKTTSSAQQDAEILPDVKELLSLVDLAAQSRSVSPMYSRRTHSQEGNFSFEFSRVETVD
mmetsp:Transcript_15025/g.27656  ORF Transcript_15025/g.27656 Transcript_15025/m.27656 type:complete len:387 (+) Transcript_15025:705-1865(+)